MIANDRLEPNSARPRIGYVDGLRAIAVLAVVMVHASKNIPVLGQYAFTRFTWHHGLQATLISLSGAGIHGVDLFFVLSGFCLSYPTLHKLALSDRTTFDLVSFATKRIVRIVPPYAVCVLLTAIAYAVIKTHGWWMPGNMAVHVGLADILKQLFFFDRHTAMLNGVFWTLPIEARWYFLFPFALWLWTVSQRAFCAVIGLAVVAFHLTDASSVDLGALPAFMSGIIAADWHIRRRRYGRYVVPAGVLALATALLFQTNERASLLWQIASFCLVVVAGESTLFQRALSTGAATAVGVASYSIYLAHEQIGEYVSRMINPVYGPVAGWLAFCASGIAAGFVFWFAVERSVTDLPLRALLLRRVGPIIEKTAAFLRIESGVPLGIPRPTKIETVHRDDRTLVKSIP